MGRTHQRWQQQASFTLQSLSLNPAKVVSYRLFFSTAQASTEVKGHKNGAGRSTISPLAALSAVAWWGCLAPDSGCSRGEAVLGWTLLFLPPPPRLGNDPISSSHFVFGSFSAACSGALSSPAQPSGALRSSPRFPCLPSAQLQHRGAAPAAPENQDDHSGVLQPHQLDSDSNLLLPYLGLFRPRVQHRRIFRGSEAGFCSCVQVAVTV